MGRGWVGEGACGEKRWSIKVCYRDLGKGTDFQSEITPIEDRNMKNKRTDPSLWGLVLLLKAFSHLAVTLQCSGPLTSHLLYVERLVLIARATLEPTGFTASDYNSVHGTPGAAP